MPAKRIIATGTVFGRWTVMGPGLPRSMGRHAKTTWQCSCACGEVRDVVTAHLLSGASVSCGCTKGAVPTHGQTYTRTYRIWCLMKGRCSNPNSPDFKYYGGRGITVCARWQEFEAFLADMGECPPGLSIDRIEVNGNYEPGNCRWASQKQQCNNQRKNTRITFDGRTKTISEWSDETGLAYSCILWRLLDGWTPERILTTPSRRAAA